jgi:pyruvate kinase
MTSRRFDIAAGSDASTPRRRTKIIATIGPASRERRQMVELLNAGADVFRLNFSHGAPSEHAEAIELAREAAALVGREVAILGDLPGPKLRIEELADGGVTLTAGEDLRLTPAEVLGSRACLPMSREGLSRSVRSGDDVFLADGRIRLRVLESVGADVHCRVETGGSVASHQGLNVPGAELDIPDAGDEDLKWASFAAQRGVDLLAVSFVSRAADLAPVEARLSALDSDIPLIAKIGRPQAAERAEEIIKAATAGVMVARGDLGIEVPIERVPAVQKRLLALAGHHSRPSITATQMLASMVESPRPTRAEVSDVASAIYQGTDAVMLSEETAVGAHPAEAVRVMDRIARATEADLPYEDWAWRRADSDASDVANSVARSAVLSSHTHGLAAIVVPTQSGRTARLVTAHRPSVPVLAISPSIETVRRLHGLFGVIAVHHDEPRHLHHLLDDCAVLAKMAGVAEAGELIGVIAGLPTQRLGTNLFEIHRVPGGAT